MVSSSWHDQQRDRAEKAVLAAIRKAKGNRRKAAKALGMSLRQVMYTVARLKARGVKVPPGPVNGYPGTPKRQRESVCGEQ